MVALFFLFVPSFFIKNKNMNKFLFTFIFLNITSTTSAQFKEVEFTTKDVIKISASIQFPKDQSTKLPAIILIHQGGSSRNEWMEIPLTNALVENGYVVLAYDIRLHGTSGKDGKFADLYDNPNRAPLDLQAAISFLKKNKKIDASRIGIIGASIGANLATVAAAEDNYGVKSVVVLSAKTSAVQNLSGQKNTISPKNAFYIASKEEQDGIRGFWANELFTLTSGNKKVSIATGNKHGSFILREHADLQDEILKWFQETL